MSAIRKKALRSDATVLRAKRVIERLGLPRDSIKIILPNGRQARSDATLSSLCRSWLGR